MSFTTVLPTAKLALSTLAENVSVPEPPARVAESISTSEGELTREGTLPEAGAESRGKTWYTSTSTSLMFSRGVPEGTNPVIVARLMTVVCCRMKSSAVSVSSFPGLARREAAPSLPSGTPVVNEKDDAHRDVTKHIPKANLAPVELTNEFTTLVIVVNLHLPVIGLCLFIFRPFSRVMA
jgi:hypothetical protein